MAALLTQRQNRSRVKQRADVSEAILEAKKIHDELRAQSARVLHFGMEKTNLRNLSERFGRVYRQTERRSPRNMISSRSWGFLFSIRLSYDVDILVTLPLW